VCELLFVFHRDYVSILYGSRKKDKKVTKVLHFPYLAEAPIQPKSCMVGDVHDIITCAKFQIESFMGYDFTGGRILDFPIDFCMGIQTV